MYNFNISTRLQEDCHEPLSYAQFVIGSKVNYPFANGKFFMYNSSSGDEGFKVKIFRVTDASDNTKLLSDVYSTKSTIIIPKGGRGKGKRSIKYFYYPKCKQPIEMSMATLPFAPATIGGCISKTNLKSIHFFRVCLGYTPFFEQPKKDVDTEAFEISITFQTKICVDCTLMYGNATDYSN